jgi:hypothetical protein
MSSAGNGRRQYSLDFSDAVADQLITLQHRAAHRGQGKEFAAAFRRIIRALRRDPYAVGEPLYRLPVLRLQMRTVVVAPLFIDFAIREERPIVYIKSGKLLAARRSRCPASGKVSFTRPSWARGRRP